MTKQSLHNKRIKLLKKFKGTYTVIKPRSKRHCNQILLAARELGLNIRTVWNSQVLGKQRSGFYICFYGEGHFVNDVGVYTHNCGVEQPLTMI